MQEISNRSKQPLKCAGLKAFSCICLLTVTQIYLSAQATAVEWFGGDSLSVNENMQLMKTLDDAWNSQDWETFKKRHAMNTAVYWPGRPEPTRGREAHYKEAVEFFKTFDNRLANNPYKILFGQDNYTCSVADWTVTMIGSMKMSDGKVVQPTHKTAKLEFCTVATWKNGEITEERLFYDVVGMMKQLGLT